MVSLQVAIPYSLLIANFYYQSNGFIKYYNAAYPYWKTLPVMALSFLLYFLDTKLPYSKRRNMAAALFLGAIGDFLLGAWHDGIYPGCVVFGIGHLLYLSTYIGQLKRLYWPLVIAGVVWGVFVHKMTVFRYLFQTHPIGSIGLLVYSLTLSAVMMVSGSLYFNGIKKPDTKNNLIRFAGYALFYASDSAYAFNHVDYFVPMAEHFILATYFAAQYLILWGNWNALVGGGAVEEKKSKR